MDLFKKNIFSCFIIHLHLFFLLISFTQLPQNSQGCHEEERRALLSFKLELDDPSHRLSSWRDDNQHRNCCEWKGIRCSYDSYHVISINLRNSDLEKHIKTDEPEEFDYDSYDGIISPSTSLTGKLSPSLFKIIHLEYLDLAYNDFQESEISYQFSILTRLVHLDLSSSKFLLSITTQFNNLSSLQYLDLSSSSGDMQTTQWLTGLTNLQVLKLSFIDLSEAMSSSEYNNFGEHISYLSSLRYLDLSVCSIQNLDFLIHGGHNFSRLSTLILDSNNLLNTSIIPAQLQNFTSLSTLSMIDCQLEAGSIPYLPQLEDLDVNSNDNFHPDLTRMFQNQWPKLRKLSISGINISQSISISNAPMLVSLSASACSIQGSLPSSIYNLSQLQFVNLSGNKISGHIHSAISNLKKLYSLDLALNNIQGSLPISISNLKNLYSLDLSKNNIQGSIPKSICEVLSLRRFVLDDNNMNGTIPDCLTKLLNLDIFSVSNNSFGGTVSLINFMNEMNLTILDLSSNRLTVVVDQHFHLYSNSPKLTFLGLSSCNISGLFPNFICEIPNLHKLDLSRNNMIGPIPSCISKLKISLLFDLSHNKFSGPLVFPHQGYEHSFLISYNNLSGTISIDMGKRLSKLDTIILAGNQFSGSIPISICSNGSQSNTKFIDLSENKLSGTIPSSIGYCTNLNFLNLGSNNLSGNVPNELEHASGLVVLQLHDNNLNGTPLNFIGKLQYLEILNLANNQFRGTIPTVFGSPVWLSILSLRSNMFNGSIPQRLFNLKQLQILDLSQNIFSGHIPKISGMFMFWRGSVSKTTINDGYEVDLQMMINGVMVQLEKMYNYSSGIDLSHNMLEGRIPIDIGLLNNLVTLNLSHNHLSGIIPTGIRNMSSLGTLDLSFNKLSGLIPQSLTSLDFLGFLNLSYNEFSGRIPRGDHFDTLSVDGSAFLGNNHLCGVPLEKICDGDRVVNSTDTNRINNVGEGDYDDAKERILLFGIVALGFVVGFWGLFFVLLLNRVKWWFPYWRFIGLVAVKITNKLYLE